MMMLRVHTFIDMATHALTYVSMCVESSVVCVIVPGVIASDWCLRLQVCVQVRIINAVAILEHICACMSMHS